MNFSFNTPLTKVIGSPMIGTQLRNNIADPYCIYKFWARSNLLSEIGNHFLFFKSSSFIPNHQFRQEPRTFPTVATRMSKTIEYSPSTNNPARTDSDCKGSSVAAPKALKNKNR